MKKKNSSDKNIENSKNHLFLNRVVNDLNFRLTDNLIKILGNNNYKSENC